MEHLVIAHYTNTAKALENASNYGLLTESRLEIGPGLLKGAAQPSHPHGALADGVTSQVDPLAGGHQMGTLSSSTSCFPFWVCCPASVGKG